MKLIEKARARIADLIAGERIHSMIAIDIPRGAECSPPVSERAQPTTAANSLLTAAALAFAAAFWDGFTYFGHGHVFANVMTANMVLFGAKAAALDPTAFRNLMPVLAYLLGAYVAQVTRLPRLKEKLPQPVLAALGVEILFLLVAGFYPSSMPDWPILLALSFIVAIQSSHFIRVEKWTYASTMPTGNLRNVAEGLFAVVLPASNPDQSRRVMVFATINVSFVIGAACGALSVAHWHNKALWIPGAALVLAFVTISADVCRKCRRVFGGKAEAQD